MDDVTSKSIGGSRMGLTHSLDHSIPSNLFIKTGLNSSPAKYCLLGICLTVFMGVLDRRKFLSNNMA